MIDKVEEAIDKLRKEVSTLRSQRAVSEEALGHLRAIYKTAWNEGFFDPYNDKSYEAAQKIWPHIKALNDELRFKT